MRSPLSSMLPPPPLPLLVSTAAAAAGGAGVGLSPAAAPAPLPPLLPAPLLLLKCAMLLGRPLLPPLRCRLSCSEPPWRTCTRGHRNACSGRRQRWRHIKHNTGGPSVVLVYAMATQTLLHPCVPPQAPGRLPQTSWPPRHAGTTGRRRSCRRCRRQQGAMAGRSPRASVPPRSPPRPTWAHGTGPGRPGSAAGLTWVGMSRPGRFRCANSRLTAALINRGFGLSKAALKGVHGSSKACMTWTQPMPD